MKYVVMVLVMSVLVACKGTPESGKNVAFFDGSKAQPKQVIETANQKIPVYDYNQFEKLLQVQNGKTYVVNFWATWCKPCVEELPFFEQLNQEYKDKGVEVVLVSLDFPNKIEKSLIPFVEEKKLTSNVLLLDDPRQNSWIPRVDKDWSGAIPATIIINENMRSFYEKSFTFIELEDEVKKFIN